ncbi:glutamate racemase [Variovorax sp. PvP013]|uniref:glutamate racemase n=1 Tax=Variovorax sp. PvP013 TaxID=3156435 RepID=UPI003D2386FE
MSPEGKRPIGVFDSGIGGFSVLAALRAELPHEDFVYFADTGHAPYGERGDDHVVRRTRVVAAELIERERIKALVVACNTATAAAIHLLRADLPGFPLVGVEPALKPAVAASRTGRIAVLATRGTVTSRKFALLREAFAAQADFSVVACDGLARAIEAGEPGPVAELCARYVAQAGRFGTAPGEIDTLVLGCTHYPFVAGELRRHTGDAVRFIETGVPVALQTRRLLASAGMLAPADRDDDPDGDDGIGRGIGADVAERIGTVRLMGTGDPLVLQAAATRWLDGPRG